MAITPAMVLGGISAGSSLLGGLSTLFGGGNTAQNVQAPPQFNMPNMGNAANAYYGGIPGLSGFNTYDIPTAQGLTQNIVNNPYAGGFQGGANTAAGMGQTAATNQFNMGGFLSGQGAGAFPVAGAVLNTGFDPQQALYNRTLQQIQDQTRVANAAAGVATTPYGAGLESQATSNFNIDWQNAQLQRQLAAMQGAGNYQTMGAGLIGQGSGMQGQAPGLYMNASAMPWSTYNTINQNPFQQLAAMGQFGQSASTIPQTQLQDYLSYLQTGNQAGGVANQNAQTQLQIQNAIAAQNAAAGKNIGAGLSGIAGLGGPTGFMQTPIFGTGGGMMPSNINPSTGFAPGGAQMNAALFPGAQGGWQQ